VKQGDQVSASTVSTGTQPSIALHRAAVNDLHQPGVLIGVERSIEADHVPEESIRPRVAGVCNASLIHAGQIRSMAFSNGLSDPRSSSCTSSETSIACI
jgi:hypothetical protein